MSREHREYHSLFLLNHYDIEDLDQLVLVVTEMLVSQGLTFTDTLVRQLILEINADVMCTHLLNKNTYLH